MLLCSLYLVLCLDITFVFSYSRTQDSSSSYLLSHLLLLLHWRSERDIDDFGGEVFDALDVPEVLGAFDAVEVLGELGFVSQQEKRSKEGGTWERLSGHQSLQGHNH